MKSPLYPLILFALFALPLPASGRTFDRTIRSDNMAFTIQADGSCAFFALKDCPDATVTGSDFWQLVLDNGRGEKTRVCSSAQRGVASLDGKGVLTISYDSVVTIGGEVLPIKLTLRVEQNADVLRFTPYLENNSTEFSVTECVCPQLEAGCLYGQKEKDRLVWQKGLCRKKKNPWTMADCCLTRPDASQARFGINSGGRFLSLSRCDGDISRCALSFSRKTYGDVPTLVLSVVHLLSLPPGASTLVPASECGVQQLK